MALLADIEPCQERLSSAKQEVATGLGQKLSEDDMKDRAMSEVEVPLLKALDPNPDNAELTKLPFYDPHELLNWLVSTGRVDVNENDIKTWWEHFHRLDVEWARNFRDEDCKCIPVSVPLLIMISSYA
ncbi:unnamed protein product [Symbiodinium sp. CCMP2456]|nr:unnamed protein product [Symbiodinium sp. CCMP2456]